MHESVSPVLDGKKLRQCEEKLDSLAHRLKHRARDGHGIPECRAHGVLFGLVPARKGFPPVIVKQPQLFLCSQVVGPRGPQPPEVRCRLE